MKLNSFFQDLRHNLLNTGSLERNFTRNKIIHRNSNSPDVNLFCILFQDNLRSQISRCPNPDCKNFAWKYFGRYSKIYQFNITWAIVLKENILRFYISMYNSNIMQINQSLQKLFDNDSNNSLMIISLVRSYKLHQIASLTQLAD